MVQENTKENTKENIVCFKDTCFKVEIAKTKQEQKTGLMFRESLDQNKGMLFVYDTPGQHSIWMKNMLISLDIVWIDQDSEVVYIKENFEPCDQDVCDSVKPDQKVKYILEINAGLIEKLGLKKGDKLDIILK